MFSALTDALDSIKTDQNSDVSRVKSRDGVNTEGEGGVNREGVVNAAGVVNTVGGVNAEGGVNREGGGVSSREVLLEAINSVRDLHAELEVQP